jgi:hypothetical protein
VVDHVSIGSKSCPVLYGEPVWQIMVTLPQIEAKTVERQTRLAIGPAPSESGDGRRPGSATTLGAGRRSSGSAPCSRAHHLTLPLDTDQREYQDCKKSLAISMRNEN